MKSISLTQGKIALVDDGDYEYLSQWKWYAHKERNTFYAVRKDKRQGGKQKMIYMHSLLINIPKGMVCDHKDRNGLNNQKQNLRVATHSQNISNSPAQGSLGARGVTRNSKTGKYLVNVHFHGSRYYVGTFKTIKDAAIAYNKKALELHGEFAFQNNIDQLEQQ